MSSPEAQQPAPEPVKRWEDIEAIANENPGALKWILVSKLRLTVPEQLKGEEGERAMNIAAVRMDQSEAIVVGSTTADTPWPTQGDTGLLHEHAEQQVLAELARGRSFDLILFFGFLVDYELCIRFAGNGKVLAMLFGVGIFVAASLLGEESCAGVSSGVFNATLYCGQVMADWDYRREKGDGPAPHAYETAQAECHKAGTDNGGVCNYIPAPGDLWQHYRQDFWLVLSALVSIPVFASLAFVVQWVSFLLCKSAAGGAVSDMYRGLSTKVVTSLSSQNLHTLLDDELGAGTAQPLRRRGRSTTLLESLAGGDNVSHVRMAGVGGGFAESSLHMPQLQSDGATIDAVPTERLVLDVANVTRPRTVRG
eukprot:COSAG03_NODE_51_length_16288_cov_69.544691_10_plen_367_part_00